MPIINRQDAPEVEQHIRRFFAATPRERTDELRALFVEKMDFSGATGSVSLAGAPSTVVLPDRAERVAVMEGLNVVYVALDIQGIEHVRKGEAVAAAKLVADQLGDDILLVMTNTSVSQLHFIYPTFEGSTPYLRRMVIEGDLPRRTAVEQLSEIYWSWIDSGSIRQAVEQAFDVEAVTTRFFKEYKRIFESVMNLVEGFGSGSDEEENKRLFVQTLFNRLMFVYFLSRKGWLTFEGEKDYLDVIWKDYQAKGEAQNYYTDRLQPLFFDGLNNPQSRDVNWNNPVLESKIGKPPFLNGGLFDEIEDEKRDGIVVPDDAIDAILHELFDSFNFTVMESTPLDVEVAVDPEMLGKVFEELVTGRHESGSYYTPRPIVAFMGREALKVYLGGQVSGLSEGQVQRFVDDRDVSVLDLTNAQEVRQALEEVTILDPACGSGAYLVGMLQELVDLETALYSQNLDRGENSLYKLKLRIIERNLYGADIDHFATNIAMLRLWLSLSIEFEGDVPPALPNLDFKIVRGDSLTSPDPAPEHQLRLFSDKAHGLRERLEHAKASFMISVGDDKVSLRAQIEGMESELADALSDRAAQDNSVEWRVQFAEIFDRRGGFDVVLANPPYRRQEGLSTKKADLKRLYPSVYAGTADYHVYFYNRSVELLREGGALSFITSNKYMRAGYGEKLREFLPKVLTLSRVVDFGDLPVFTAASYPAIVVGRKGVAPDERTVQVADLSIPVRRMLLEEGRPVNKDTVARAMDRLPQFLARDGVSDYPQVLLRKGGWILEDPKLVRLFDRLMSQGTPLGEFVQRRMYYGIKTGLNEAFVIREAKRKELAEADPRSMELIKPWLRGRDIKRWRVEWTDTYCLHVPWNLSITEYPAVLRHLTLFRSALERRPEVRDGRFPWYAMSRWASEYHSEFANAKVVFSKFVDEPRFAFDTSGAYTNNANAFIVARRPWLTALLQSRLMWFLTRMRVTRLQNGFFQLMNENVYPLPIISPGKAADEYDEKVLELGSETNSSNRVSQLEAELNELINHLYGLTAQEARLVDAWHEAQDMMMNLTPEANLEAD